MKNAKDCKYICDSWYDHRLHGVLPAIKGMSSYQAGAFLGHHSTTILRWINDFNRSGFAGLYNKEKSGRSTFLDECHFQ